MNSTNFSFIKSSFINVNNMNATIIVHTILFRHLWINVIFSFASSSYLSGLTFFYLSLLSSVILLLIIYTDLSNTSSNTFDNDLYNIDVLLALEDDSINNPSMFGRFSSEYPLYYYLFYYGLPSNKSFISF